MPTKPFTEEEKEKLLEFRENVKDILKTEEQESDFFLIRWLRARSLDLGKAEQMLRTSMKWREENKVDGIVERESDDIPMIYKKIYPTGVFGEDLEGDPLIYLPLGRFTHKIAIEDVGLPTFLRWNIIWAETLIEKVNAYEEQRGVRGLQFVEIVDMEYYSFKELTYKPSRDFIVETQKIFEANYPELLKTVLIINAPRIFAIVFGMLKPLLPKETLDKIDIYGQDEDTWKVVMKERFCQEFIPPRFGGSLKGSDQFCSQDAIWMDGPIPLSYFTRDEVDADGLIKVKVPARDKLKINLEVVEKGSEIHWQFKTEGHDIGLQIKDPDGDICLPLNRLESQHSLQDGKIACKKIGNYQVIFDNSFSYTKSKTLSYNVEVVDSSLTKCEEIDLN